MDRERITPIQGKYSSLFTAARDKKDSPSECVAIIRKAEAHAGHAQDWSLCADAWLNCLNDAENATRCLLEAECRFHDICRELAICASGWLTLLKNPEAAQRCVRKIASIASSAEDWDYCAEFLANAGCRKLAGFCLKQSEKYASNTVEWLERAKVWRDLLHDDENSRRCEATLACLTRCEDSVERIRMMEKIQKSITDNFDISLQQEGSAEDGL